MYTCFNQNGESFYFGRGQTQGMVIGSFEYTLDAKGRVFIPAKWRDAMGDTIIVTLGILGSRTAKCLFGMSLPAWDVFSDKLSRLPITDVAGQAVRRRLYAMAAGCEVDKQGRILIPPMLREATGINKDATLIGVGDRIEIWNPAELAAATDMSEEAYGAALGHLAELGI